MSLYIIVGIGLLLGTTNEVLKRKTNDIVYIALFSALLLMLVFRFGQGTDYFAYQYIYEKLPNQLSLKALNDSSIHSELGWKFLCVLFRKLGLHYRVFVAFIGSVTMFFLNSFIQKYCPFKVSALFIAYPTLFLTYICSGMRQGLVICAFLGIILDLYLKKKKWKLFIAVCLCASIHTASWVLLILLLDVIKDFIVKNERLIVFFSWIAGVSFSLLGFNVSLFNRTFVNNESKVSYIAIAERLLTYIVIQILYDKYKQVNKKNELLDSIMYVYALGIIFFGITYAFPVVASRLCYFFKCTEIIICTIIMAADKYKNPEYSTMFFYIAALSIVMCLKNIDSYLSQGHYYSDITVWNYPYNNIFTMGDYRYSFHQELID